MKLWLICSAEGQMPAGALNSEEYRAFRERVHAFRYAPCLFCGGCEHLQENKSDCVGSLGPTCGGCLWGQGFAVCP